MEKPVNDLTVVVLGAHLLTRSMHMEITSLLRHSPGYCFFVQSLREPSALFMMESEGVRFISQDTPLFPVDSATAPSDAVSRAVTALLRRSSHCVFSQVDLSLTSAKLVSAAAAGLGVTVFMMHSAQRLHKSYERFTNTLLDFGNDPTALDTSTKSSNIVKSSVIDGISIIHMVGDLHQHFSVMNWAIGRMERVRDRLLMQFNPSRCAATIDAMVMDSALAVVEDGSTPSPGHVDSTDSLEQQSNSQFRSFCMECFEGSEDRKAKKTRIKSTGARNKILYVNETGLLSLSNVESSSRAPRSALQSDSASDLTRSTKPNSLAKLLSFSNYYYSNSSRDHASDGAGQSGISPLFDYDFSASGVFAPTSSGITKPSPPRKRQREEESQPAADSADGWVPKVLPPDNVSKNGDIVGNDYLSRQNSYLPLLSQISVISCSAEYEGIRNSGEGIKSNWSLGKDWLQMESDASMALLSQETDDTVIEESSWRQT